MEAAMITDYLFLLLTFPIASVLHGGDYVPKGWLIAGHALLSLASGWFAPLGVACYWLFFRRGKQARAELDLLAGASGFDKIQAAYPPVIGYVMRKVHEWNHDHPLAEFGGQPSRRQQELAGSFVLGVILAIPFVLIPAIIGL